MQQRAVLAAALRYPAATAGAALSVCPRYVTLVRALSADDRYRVFSKQLSLSELANARRKPPNDAAVRRTVERLGVERVLGVIDVLTAPHRIAAE